MTSSVAAACVTECVNHTLVLNGESRPLVLNCESRPLDLNGENGALDLNGGSGVLDLKCGVDLDVSRCHSPNSRESLFGITGHPWVDKSDGTREYFISRMRIPVASGLTHALVDKFERGWDTKFTPYEDVIDFDPSSDIVCRSLVRQCYVKCNIVEVSWVGFPRDTNYIPVTSLTEFRTDPANAAVMKEMFSRADYNWRNFTGSVTRSATKRVSLLYHERDLAQMQNAFQNWPVSHHSSYGYCVQNAILNGLELFGSHVPLPHFVCEDVQSKLMTLGEKCSLAHAVNVANGIPKRLYNFTRQRHLLPSWEKTRVDGECLWMSRPVNDEFVDSLQGLYVAQSATHCFVLMAHYYDYASIIMDSDTSLVNHAVPLTLRNLELLGHLVIENLYKIEETLRGAQAGKRVRCE
jgi:hypothetical protein